MTNENSPEITVCIHCMTYNHEKYLADALEGFVMQKTDFPFVAVVIDDCSTDGTADVLRRYEEKYPDIIKAVYLQENYYSQQKSKQPFLEPWDSKAKYIALCEGDDYWTDPLKLQKQVDYLECQSNCIMCVNATEWDENGKRYVAGCQYDCETDLPANEIIKYGGLYVSTASTIFRKELISHKNKCPWWLSADVGDYPLHIAGSIFGNIHFFPEIMTVYRYRHEGAWTSAINSHWIEHTLNEISWLEQLDVSTNRCYHQDIYYRIVPYYIALFRAHSISLGKLIRTYYSLTTKLRSVFRKSLVKAILFHYFPQIYNSAKKCH